MLSLHPLDDQTANTALFAALGRTFDGQTIAVSADDTDIGYLNFTISADLTAHIRAVYVLEEFRGKGFGDFLTRSMMNSFTLANIGVCIDYADDNDYFGKFGFKKTEKGLYVSPEDIVFPSKCGHH